MSGKAGKLWAAVGVVNSTKMSAADNMINEGTGEVHPAGVCAIVGRYHAE